MLQRRGTGHQVTKLSDQLGTVGEGLKGPCHLLNLLHVSRTVVESWNWNSIAKSAVLRI